MTTVILLIVLAEIWGTIGNVLFKKSINDMEFHSLSNARLYLKFLTNVVKEPLIWAGLISMGLCLVTWLVALSKSDLSFAFPVSSIHYILILFFAHLFLDEKIDAMKLIGTIGVFLGIILTAIK